MDIDITRAIVNAALEGGLTPVQHCHDPLFHLDIPTCCPKVPPHLLNPATTWNDKNAFAKRAEKLAAEFRVHFEKTYENKGLDPAIRSQCPGIID
jgi:phosphoenolpyruvate carboxykinase (ATP)